MAVHYTFDGLVYFKLSYLSSGLRAGDQVAAAVKRTPILWKTGSGKAGAVSGQGLNVASLQTEENTVSADRLKPNTKYLQNVITNVDQGNKRKMANTASGAGLQVSTGR